MPKREPLRLFAGNAKPYEPFWVFRNATDGSEAELEFYGPISEYSWWGDEITPKKFKEDLNKYGAGGPITIRMNSGGGDVIAASVIKSILMEYPGQVTVMIDGLAASAATVVAMAGDIINIHDSAYFMIHDPSTWVWGTIDEIKQVLDVLKTIKEGIIDVYNKRTELGIERLSRMMTDETWMTAREAHEAGFVDEVITEKITKRAAATAQSALLQNYVHVPAPLLSAITSPVNEPAVDPAIKRLQAEIQFYLKEKQDEPKSQKVL